MYEVCMTVNNHKQSCLTDLTLHELWINGYRLARLYKSLEFSMRYQIYDENGECLVWIYVRNTRAHGWIARLNRGCVYGRNEGLNI